MIRGLDNIRTIDMQATHLVMEQLVRNSKECYRLRDTSIYYLDYFTLKGEIGTIYFNKKDNNVVLKRGTTQTNTPRIPITINSQTINTIRNDRIR